MNEKEKLEKEIQEHKQKMQLDFTTDLLDRIEHYNNKALKKDYEPSNEERIQFNIMVNIFNNMKEWF